jgi:hypothetical protein
MGSRNPERDKFLASDFVHVIDWHRQYPGWAILVSCACLQQDYVCATEVLRMPNPPNTIGAWKERRVCSSCGSQKLQYNPRFVGERR